MWRGMSGCQGLSRFWRVVWGCARSWRDVDGCGAFCCFAVMQGCVVPPWSQIMDGCRGRGGWCKFLMCSVAWVCHGLFRVIEGFAGRKEVSVGYGYGVGG